MTQSNIKNLLKGVIYKRKKWKLKKMIVKKGSMVIALVNAQEKTISGI